MVDPAPAALPSTMCCHIGGCCCCCVDTLSRKQHHSLLSEHLGTGMHLSRSFSHHERQQSANLQSTNCWPLNHTSGLCSAKLLRYHVCRLCLNGCSSCFFQEEASVNHGICHTSHIQISLRFSFFPHCASSVCSSSCSC